MNNEWCEVTVLWIKLGGKSGTRKTLISVEVKAEIHAYFGVGSTAAVMLWMDWLGWFRGTCIGCSKGILYTVLKLSGPL